MPLKTTVIGSFPKPDYLKTPDWFRLGEDFDPRDFNTFKAEASNSDLTKTERRAIQEVLDEQTELGIDFITDGEVTRENYIFHFLRTLKGFNFDNVTLKTYRNGACTSNVPTIRGLVSPSGDKPWVVEEWKQTQAMTSTPVKATIPGPLTIINTSYNAYYKDQRELSRDLVSSINREVVALAEAGCTYIQIDEPLLVREPDTALEYSIDHLKDCFKGVENDVKKGIHLCCGYPQHLDQEDYPKADKNAYIKIADKLDAAGFDAISIEDAHRRVDLELFTRFQRSSIVLGCVAVARSRVETVEEIRDRVREVLQYIPPERLWLAPDCGLAFLPKDILKQKVTNMVTVAKSLP